MEDAAVSALSALYVRSPQVAEKLHACCSLQIDSASLEPLAPTPAFCCHCVFHSTVKLDTAGVGKSLIDCTRLLLNTFPRGSATYCQIRALGYGKSRRLGTSARQVLRDGSRGLQLKYFGVLHQTRNYFWHHRE